VSTVKSESKKKRERERVFKDHYIITFIGGTAEN
jgi:hypothetical protein